MEVPFPWHAVTRYGATADGRTLCTEAFARAFAACEAAGGGTVFVPAGTYLSGPIELRSNTTLMLDAGARVIFSRDEADYPVVRMRWEGAECDVFCPQIFGRDLENVAVTGRGTLDGQGGEWWLRHREGGLAHARPRLIAFVNCRNVLIEGVKLQNSPAWTVNPILCENVTVDKITIVNPPDSPNTDGINPESCRNVHISNCHVDVGDDCVTIKAGREDCLPRAACENIVITNCTMVHGHGGVVIGSEMSGGVRNVAITNCVFVGTDRGIRLKSRRGRGGTVEDVRVANVVMQKVMCPIVIHQFYHCGAGGKEKSVWSKDPAPVTEGTLVFRRIHFSQITARGTRAAAAFIYGLPEMPVEEITFNHVSVEMARNAEPETPAMMSFLEPMRAQGFICHHIRNVVFDHVGVSGHEGPAFHLAGARGVEMAWCTADGKRIDGSSTALDEAEDVQIKP